MSYGRMSAAEQRLEEEIADLLEQAQQADDEEDAKYGKGKRGDELPKELQRRTSRLKKIREAKAALEAAAKEAAKQKADEAQAKLEARQAEERKTGKKPRGKPPRIPDVETAKPDPKAQRNFTDPESRIMKDGASKSFEQCYNAQIAVDDEAQVIVATDVTQETNDKKQLIPMIQDVEENAGKQPRKLSADSGYFSETNVTDERLKSLDLYIPPDRAKHGEKAKSPRGRKPKNLSIADQMRWKLQTKRGQEVYRFRKAIVEPVFGQIKEALGFRRFSMRGLDPVRHEWIFVCLAHNVLKLFRSGWCAQGGSI